MKKIIFGTVAALAASAWAFDSSTVAFYPFTDGAPDTTPTTISNAVDTVNYPGSGTVYKHTGTSDAHLTFDSDVPGKYIFDDISFAFPHPVAVDPQSVYMTSTTESYSGGRLDFANIGTLVSGLTESTVEFFFKIPADETIIAAYCRSCAMAAGKDGDALKYLCLSIPLCVTDTANSRDKYVAAFVNGSEWGKYSAAAPTSLADGAWHHVAIVCSNGAYKAIVDYKYATVEVPGITAGPDSAIADSKPFSIGAALPAVNTSAFHGKIACVRVSTNALPVAKMLHASDNPRYSAMPRSGEAVAMPDALAFYSFKEGAGHIGESALGKQYVNDVDDATFDGVDQNKGTVTYDDDVPGKYIFSEYRIDAPLMITDPVSLKMNAGDIHFKQLGTELSKCEEGTIEFFWKMEHDDPVSSWKVGVDTGLKVLNSTEGKSGMLGFYVPLEMRPGASGKTYVNQVRLWSNSANLDLEGAYDPPDDGKWHHIAGTFSNGVFNIYCDYVQTMSKPASYGFSVLESAANTPLKLGAAGYIGRLACLRVSKKALTPEKMLRASSLPSCKPLELFYYKLDGTVGENATTLANSAPTFTSVNTNQFFWSQLATSSGSGQKGGDHYPVYSDTKAGVAVTNLAARSVDGSAAFYQATSKSSASVIFAAGPELRSAWGEYIAGDFTSEGFFKFDREGYMEKIGSVWGETRHRFSIVHFTSSAVETWKFYIDNALGAKQYSLVLAAKAEGAAEKSATKNVLRPLDTRWHHFAVIYDATAHTLTGYIDYAPEVELQLAGPLDYSGGARYFGYGNGGNNQPFCGWFDELRTSAGKLDPQDFLRVEKNGMLMYVK